jgi:hypothetical protein
MCHSKLVPETSFIGHIYLNNREDVPLKTHPGNKFYRAHIFK